jgi:hypothetical protein
MWRDEVSVLCAARQSHLLVQPTKVIWTHLPSTSKSGTPVRPNALIASFVFVTSSIVWVGLQTCSKNLHWGWDFGFSQRWVEDDRFLRCCLLPLYVGMKRMSIFMTMRCYIQESNHLIREVPGSNFVPEIGYPDLRFCGFPQSLQANVGIVPRFYHECFLPHPLQFDIHSSYLHSTLYSLSYWESVVKRTTKRTFKQHLEGMYFNRVRNWTWHWKVI